MSILMHHTVKFFAFFALVWSFLVALLFWTHQEENEKALHVLALAEARSHFEKDTLIRSWATSHGGVYVPPSAKTPPNPHLYNHKERDVVTTDGKALTLMHPAYMTRELHELAKERSGVQGHLTSLNLIRGTNKPDAWEREALEAFEKGYREWSSLEKSNGKKALRYMGAVMAEEGCIHCHTSYKVGEVRGGISVTLPMERYDAIAREKATRNRTNYGGLWLFGLLGIGLSLFYLHYLIRQHDALARASCELELKESFLESIGEGVYGIERDGTLSFVNAEALRLSGYTKEELLGKNPHEIFHSHPLGHACSTKEMCILSKAKNTGISLNGRSQFYKKDGSVFPVEVRATPFLRANMSRGAVVLFRDITEELKHENELRTLASTDPLTKAKNRRLFEEWLTLHYGLYKRNTMVSYMLMIDIDFFKKVNDTYGHQAGDDVLVYLVAMVQEEVRLGDCFARIGGEEFSLLLSNVSMEDALKTAERVRLSLQNARINTCEGELTITVSIGVSGFLPHDEGIEGIISRADDALYYAKKHGRNRVIIKMEHDL